MAKRSDTPSVPETDYEKISYGKAMYKRVQRLRRKAKRRGIEVPRLNYELHKPEKPRVTFWIVGGVGLLLLLGILVGTGFLAKYAIGIFSVTFKETGGIFQTLLNPTVFLATMGFSIVPIVLLVTGYLLFALLLLVPVMFVVYCYRFTRDSFYMAKCSKEEFAKGAVISTRIIKLSVVLVVLLVAFIAVLASNMPNFAKLLLGLVCAGIMLLIGGLLAVMAVEKKKCKKWFETLDEDQKQNFLAHNNALRRIKQNLSREKQIGLDSWLDL